MKLSSVNLQVSCFLYLQGCMPIKWTAPEILSGNVVELSTQSDVYVHYVWVIDQVWGQDGSIFVKFFFCEFMDLDSVSVHNFAKKE